MDLDLHLHTTASDGTVSPGEVVRRAAQARLDVIALTDHDTVAGLPEARAAVGNRPIEIIPALEVSSTWEGRDIHVLGYFVDPEHPAMVEHGRRASRRREERLRLMAGRLASQGIEVHFDEVLDAAGADVGSLGRPHLARALVARGHARSVSDAFDRWIGDEHPAFVPTQLLSPREAIALVAEAGGIPVWAHPPADLLDRLLPTLVAAGLRGLEVYRPYTPEDEVRRLERLARSAGLLVSGGSDWHGPDNGELGRFRVSSRDVERLLEAGGL